MGGSAHNAAEPLKDGRAERPGIGNLARLTRRAQIGEVPRAKMLDIGLTSTQVMRAFSSARCRVESFALRHLTDELQP